MAITRAAASSVIQGLPKRKSALAGNLPILAGSFESIATVTVGAGGSSTITFSSIPSTFKHLQIRAIAKNSQNTGTFNTICFGRFNSDTGSNYTNHQLKGNGASATASSNSPDNAFVIGSGLYTDGTSAFNGFIIDILDYTNTNKYTTIRALNGCDLNGSGIVTFNSGAWLNTAAVTRIDIPEVNGSTYAQYSHFALYGIKG